MPLSESDILQSNSGSFEGANGTATLGVATTAGSVVLLAVGQNGVMSTPSGFTRATETTSSGSPSALYWKLSAGGETSWTVPGTAASVVGWYVEEWAPGTLDPTAPVDVLPPSGQAAGTAGPSLASDTTPTSTTYDGVAYGLHLGYLSTDPVPVTWGSHTGGFAEVIDVGGAGTGKSVGLSVSRQFTQTLQTFGCTATASATMTQCSAAVVVLSAQGAKRAPNIAHFWGFKVGAAAGLATGVATAKYFETQTGTPVIGADGLQLTGVASIQHVTSPTLSIAGVAGPGHVARIRFRLDSLSGDLVVATILEGVRDVVVRYVSASSKIGVKVGAGAEQLSDATVTTGQFYNLDLRLTGTTTTRTTSWRLDDVDQADATDSFAGPEGMGQATARLGWAASSTGTVTYAYSVHSGVAGHYPLGDFTFALLKPDPADTITISGTAGNFQTFSSNGTMAAWNAATALTNISEGPPPTIGASAAGLAQITLAASDYVNIPMETVQGAPSGAVRAVRMLACGWAASATAATIGFRGWDGTAETTLFAAADPEFDNSTTTPAWVCKMYRPTGGWTQAKLDALAFRVGFSGDATPDIGIHAIYAEVAIQVVETQTLFGTMASQQLDPVTGGVLGVTVDTTVDPGKAADLTYEESGSPTTVPVAADTSHTEVTDAADATIVNRIELYPDPEPAP